MDVTLEVSDNDYLTAVFTCTAFGGDGAVLRLDITWSGVDISLESGYINPDNSVTSTLTTEYLTLEDRGNVVTCTVMFQGGINGSSETASLNIGTA